MSDSLASERTLERPSDNGQVERASEAQPQGSTGGSASSNGQPTQDDIKNLQRKLSEKDIQAKQALQEAQRASALAQQLQQRLAQMEEANAPDDYARMELRVKRAEETAAQYAAALQQTQQEKAAERAKYEALDRIAERYGVSRDDLLKAEDYESAVELAIETRDKSKQKQQQQNDDKRERNTVDVGGGVPTTAKGKWEDDYAEAQRRGDSLEMVRLKRIRGDK